MIIGVSVLSNSIVNQDTNEEQLKKSKLIYWRLLDIVYKIDFIKGNETGKDFINLSELGTDTRLDNKFNVIQ